MKIMTRHVGFFTRPLIQLYADREVIACGIRPDNDEKVTIIYTPFTNRQKHVFFKKQNQAFIKVDTKKVENFSGNAIQQAQLPHPKINDTYIVTAEHTFKKNIRTVTSPKIQIKKSTKRINAFLHSTKRENGEVYFSWKDAKQYKPMIYFFVIYDEGGNTVAGIYTRETCWTYPYFNKASLVINETTKKLDFTKSYTAKLLLVDYEGWVSHMARIDF